MLSLILFPKAKYLSLMEAQLKQWEQTARLQPPQRHLEDPLRAASLGPFCRVPFSICRDKATGMSSHASPRPTVAEGKPIRKGPPF